MYQEVSNLKNGTYIVSCAATCGWGDGSSVSLYAKNAEGTVISSEPLPSNEDAGWQEIGLVAEVTDGTLTIGVASDGEVAANGWGNIDSFHLGMIYTPEEDAGEDETEVQADFVNDRFWQDTDGNTIFSQGGGIFKFGDKYYWYGVKYEEAEMYAENPRKYYTSSDVFVGITCYSSTDLKNWTYEGLVADPDDVYNEEIMGTTRPYTISNGKTTWLDGDEVKNTAAWVGRLGVTQLADGDYALLVQHECADYDNEIDGDDDQWSKQVLVLTADSPTGHFTWNNRINMKSAIGTTNTGDQTVFIDDDGTGWLVYSYGSGRGKMYLSKITREEGEEKVTLGAPYMVYSGAGREGNCMFKYNGKYYLCASDLYGWNASHGYYMTIDPGEMSLEEYLKSDSFQPATSLELMDGTSDDFCHVSQTGFFYTVEGSEQDTVIFCGDRWADFAGNGLGFNQWCPLSFNESGEPYFNSLSAWNLDIDSGVWSVATGNNYVKNGSFEADRVVVDDIAGWSQTTTKGSKAITNVVTMSDDYSVTGKGSLKIGSTSAYDVKLSQEISSSPYVDLEDGVYQMTAKVKNSGSFDRLQMYAESGGRTFATSFVSANPVWTTVKIEDVVVTNHAVEIGFLATGGANSECRVDDVTFTGVENAELAEGSITGKITGDEAAAGKELTVTAVNGTDSYSVKLTLSTEEQEFSIANLPDGSYTVSFLAKDCTLPEAVEIAVSGGAAELPENMTVTNHSGAVSGKIISEDAGLADVTVTLSKEGGDDITVTTAEDGTYMLEDIGVGTYHITFVKKGYAVNEGAPETVEIKLNETVTIPDVTMTKNAGNVSGKVTNKYGVAVENAVVTLIDKSNNGSQYTATTDENGDYVMEDVVEGTYTASATTMEKAEDAWQELNAGDSNVAVEAKAEVTCNLQFAIDMTSSIVNPTFDESLDGWTNGASGTGGYRLGKKNTHGTYQLAPWSNNAFTMDTYQTITGLKNGTYIVTCWENADYVAESDKLELYAKDGNGTVLARENIPANSKYETIVLIAEVTDGTLTIGVDGGLAASSWANIDDFHLGLMETEHDYTGVVTKAATCTEDGLMTYTCKYDSESYTENIPALNHKNAVLVEATDGSCTQAGHGSYWSCPDCGKLFKDQNGSADLTVGYDNVEDVTTVTEAGEHSYGDPVFTWSEDDTTCTAAFKCEECQETATVSCTVSSKQTVAPTCTAEGTMTYTATVSFNGSDYTDTKTSAIPKTEHHYVTTTDANGATVEKCSVCGDIKSTTGNSDNDATANADKDVKIESVTLAKTAYTYTGKAIQPAVTAKDSAGNVVDASNYTVAYANNKNVGKATATVTFTGTYSGVYKLSFTIQPKGTNITKTQAKSKAMKLTWKKQKTQVTGYEIRYSTSKKFKAAKKLTVNNAKTTSKSISKLKANKKYYVQIRTYKKVGKTKYYSSWSKTKTVKTRK